MYWLLIILIIPYFGLIMWILRGLNIDKLKLPAKPGNTIISVILPCKNEEKTISRIISDLEKQTLNSELFELIIVDDNSRDSTFVIASASSSISHKLVLKNRGKGKKSAILTGVTSAKGDLILTTDADCRVGVRWLETIRDYYDENKANMIICPVVLESGKGFFNKFQELEFLSLQGITAGSALINNPVMCNGAGLAFTREAYLRNSANLNFGIASGDDIFLLQSLKKEDPCQIKWIGSPEVTVTAQLSGSVWSFLKQRVRWISKTGHYKDHYATILAFVTFVTILVQTALLVASVISPVLLPVFIVSVIIKSIPDYLILNKIASIYHKKHLLKWFIPSVLVYPFYVIAVSILIPLYKNSWKD